MTILVTGARGNVARALVGQLLDVGQQVRAVEAATRAAPGCPTA